MKPSSILYAGALLIAAVAPPIYTFVCKMTTEQMLASMAISIVYGGVLASSETLKAKGK